MNPMKRNEGPLFYCIYEGLVDQAYLRDTPDGCGEFAYVVNAYIHLLPAAGRRGAIMDRIHLETWPQSIQVQKYPERKRTHEQSGTQETKFPWVSPRQFYLERVTREETAKNEKLQKELALAKSKAIPTPALPSKPNKVSMWPPADSVPPMPDSL